MTPAAFLLGLLCAAASAQDLQTLYFLPGSTETLAVPLLKLPPLTDALLEMEGTPLLRLVEGTDLGPRTAGEDGVAFRMALQAAPTVKRGEGVFEVRAKRLNDGEVLWRRRINAVILAPGPGAKAPARLPAAPGVKCWELKPSRVCGPDERAILRHHARRFTGDLAHAARILRAMEERAAAYDSGLIGAVDAHDVLGALEAGYGEVLSSMTALGRLSPPALAAVSEELAREGLTQARARKARKRAAERQAALRRRHPVLGRADASYDRLLAVERAQDPQASTAALAIKLARQPIRLGPRLEAMAALADSSANPAETALFLMDLVFPAGEPPPESLAVEQAAVLDLLPRLSTAAAPLVPRLAALLGGGLVVGHDLVERALLSIGTPDALEAVDSFERDLFRAVTAVPASGWQGFESGLRARGGAAARSRGDWEELWARHRPGRPAPELDFDAELVAGLFLGGANPAALRLEAVERSTTAVTVVFSWLGEERSPYPTAAFALARLPATRLPVRVVERWRRDERSKPRETLLYESPAR